MDILESTDLGSDTIAEAFDTCWLPQLKESNPSHLIVDANWRPEHLARWLEAGRDIDAHITFEPVSNVKGTSIFRLPKRLGTYKLLVVCLHQCKGSAAMVQARTCVTLSTMLEIPLIGSQSLADLTLFSMQDYQYFLNPLCI